MRSSVNINASNMKEKKDYIASPALQYALEAALVAGQPLLLTGEPGTGKTEMADWALQYLLDKEGDYYPEVLRFNTKTSSRAGDLFYTYDALSHFQAANLPGAEKTSADKHITLNAFGKAVVYSNPELHALAQTLGMATPDKPLSSVVLIDEVDKAPRDFTNDLLYEMVEYSFHIRELTNMELKKAEGPRIVVILTSNSEKNLPDAFLRRCAFFHIAFPKGEELRKIVELHLGQGATAASDEAYRELITFFENVRSKSVRKAPATAELVTWLRILGMDTYQQADPTRRRELLERSLPLLVKTKDDLEVARSLIHER